MPTFTNYWQRAGNVVSTATAGDLVQIGSIGSGPAAPLATSRLYVGGLMQISSLSGGGSRMLVTDNTGTITAQPIPVTNFWTRSGNDVSFLNVGDELGIGTAAPTAALHVNGTIRFQNLAAGLGTDNLVTIDGAGSVRNISMATVEAATGMGNHIANRNIVLGGFYLSGDGDPEGVRVATDGRVSIGGLPIAGNTFSVNGAAQVGTATAYSRMLGGNMTTTGKTTTATFQMTTGAVARVCPSI